MKYAKTNLQPNAKATSIGPLAASLFPSNSDKTSKACSFQSKVCVTTTLDRQTLP